MALLPWEAAGATRRASAQTGGSGGTTIAVIGDYGSHNSQAERVSRLVSSWSPDHVATVGDNIYTTPPGVAGTDMFDLAVGRFYCEFMAGAAPGPNCPSGGDSAVNRFFPAPGNHDYSDAGIELYLEYFDLPGEGTLSASPSGSQRYYDVVLGHVHLFVLDGAPALENPGYRREQRDWLEAAVTASTAPWQVVTVHEPPYSSGAEHGSNPEFQWPFALWGVDLVLSGHEHSYERLERDGITYIVNGLGGASRYPFSEPVGGSRVRYNANDGALRLDATPGALRLEMATVDGEIVDRFDVPAAPDLSVAALQDGVGPSTAYEGTGDASISEAEPNRSLGDLPWLRANGDPRPDRGRRVHGLVSWDLDPLPAGSRITSAWITFHVTNTARLQTYGVHAVLRPWDEATVTWNSTGAGQSWELPGATGASDRLPGPVGVLDATRPGPARVLLDDRAVALLQTWHDRSTPAGGFMIASPENSDGVEVASGEAEQAAQRPRLEVVYEPPGGIALTPASRQLTAQVGRAFVARLAATGGVPPYRWSVTSGALPDGLALQEAGVVGGRPRQTGNWSAEVVVTDANGATSMPTRLEVSVVVPTKEQDDGSGLAFFRWAAVDVMVITAVGAVAVLLIRRSRSRSRGEGTSGRR
jgi:hypothetical protein